MFAFQESMDYSRSRSSPLIKVLQDEPFMSPPPPTSATAGEVARKPDEGVAYGSPTGQVGMTPSSSSSPPQVDRNRDDGTKPQGISMFNDIDSD